MTTELLIERVGYRAMLVLDDAPRLPEYAGAIPQFTVYHGHGRWQVGCEMNEGELPDNAVALLDAWVNFHHKYSRDVVRANEMFARYCRIVYGVEYVRVRDYSGYVQGSGFKLFELAPVAWCESMGVTVEQLDKETDDVPELVSYAIGDCWDIVIEKTNRYVNVNDPEDFIETWDEVSRCGGFYGESDTPYFKEAAEEMLSEQI